MRDNKGFAVAAVLLFFSVVFIGFYALVNLGSAQARTQAQTIKNAQTLYLAEAAMQKAVSLLRDQYLTFPVLDDDVEIAFGNGEHKYKVEMIAGKPLKRLITGFGAMPDFVSALDPRSIEIVMEGSIITMPPVFDKAIYSVGDIRINGVPNIVNGDVFAGDDLKCNPPMNCSGITGAKEWDNNPNYPLPGIDFEALRSAAKSQGNYHASTPAASDLPTSFYYTPPGMGDPGVPNIVYIEGDLVVNDLDSVAGFIIAGGHVIDDPIQVGDATMNGSAHVDGVIYATGTYTDNGGGGGGANINGGVLAEEGSVLNGNTTFVFDQAYMDLIQDLQVPSSVFDLLYWDEQ